jgi:hypothetical protein
MPKLMTPFLLGRNIFVLDGSNLFRFTWCGSNRVIQPALLEWRQILAAQDRVFSIAAPLPRSMWMLYFRRCQWLWNRKR